MRVRVVVAAASREVRGSLFLALDGIEAVEIVAAATSLAELSTQCRLLRPDVAIVGAGLSRRSLSDVLEAIGPDMESGRIFIVGGENSVEELENVQRLDDVAQILSAVVDTGS